jgi:pyruvate formate lyase activating enzyme
MDKSNGGVTVTGGEALLQPAFVGMFFLQLHRMGVHICLNTNGYTSKYLYGSMLDKILDNTDMVMLDIKQMDNAKHEQLTGISNEKTLNFARHLDKTNQLARIRYVVIPGYTDDLEDIYALTKLVKDMNNIQLIELLPYHKIGGAGP